MAIRSISPATGQELKSFSALTSEQIESRLSLAAEAWKDYTAVPIDHRALCMRKLATLLEEEMEELANLMVQEIGKPIRTARQEIEKCAATCRFYAEHAARMLQAEIVPAASGRSYIQWDPIGTVLAIMPWNYPFWQVIRFIAPALMAGNGCLLKHAPNVPQCALSLETLVRRAGFPRGIFQTLLLENEQVEGIIRDPRIAAVTLTGSDKAGALVAAQAGSVVKKCVLELGGSDPFIVMPTADFRLAVETAVKARTVNNGQSCIAAKRFIVHSSLYEEFVQRLTMHMDALKVGDPAKEETEVGPLVSARALETVERQVRDAIAAGGRILTGGAKLVSPGYYFEPTVLVDVPRTAPVYREEIFAPVAMVFRASNVEEAIEIANDTPYGLGASVWTRDPAEQQRFVSAIASGMVFLNAMVTSEARLPFGGIKGSGYGRELSVAGMREFMNAKSVVVA